MGKMFALSNLDGDFSINLKCDPDLAIELREHYPAVLPGYHMNKAHWNTVVIDGSISNKLIFEWTDHSYQLVADQLTKTLKNKLKTL
jgi:predicted DNA-binding protein (MmcQ/YjbR family)